MAAIDPTAVFDLYDATKEYWWSVMKAMPLWYSCLIALLARIFYKQIYFVTEWRQIFWSVGYPPKEASRFKKYTWSVVILFFAIPAITCFLALLFGGICSLLFEHIPSIYTTVYQWFDTGDSGVVFAWVGSALIPHLVAYITFVDWEKDCDEKLTSESVTLKECG